MTIHPHKFNSSPYEFYWMLHDRAGRPVYIDKGVYADLQAFILPDSKGQTITWEWPSEGCISLEHARKAALAALDFLGCRARFKIEPAADHPDAFVITKLPGLRPLPAAIRRAKRDLNRRAKEAQTAEELCEIVAEYAQIENSTCPGQPLPYQKRGRKLAETSKFGWETLNSPGDIRYWKTPPATLQNSFNAWKRARGLDDAKIVCAKLYNGEITAVSRVR